MLIVEDDPQYLDLILNRLKIAGYINCDRASRLDEALDLLQVDNSYYDIVVADMRLDENSRGGFYVAHVVKDRNLEAPPDAQAQVIILTANNTTEDAREALRCGPHEQPLCRDYISKTMAEGERTG